jgi:hypothetical protein
MILKEDALVKLNNRGKIQENIISLNYHPFEDVYSIQRRINQRGGKEIDIPVLFFRKNEHYPSHETAANLRYKALIDRYLSNGYKSIKQLSKKSYSSLSDEELIDLILKHGFTNEDKCPAMVAYKSHSSCHSQIYEKDLYVTKSIEGCRFVLYMKNKKIITYNKFGNDCSHVINHIITDPKLLKWFQQNPKMYLECKIYIPEITYSLKEIVRLTTSKKYVEECKLLHLHICDVILEEPIQDRIKILEHLQDIFQNHSFITVAKFQQLSGFLKIYKEYKQAISEGYAGLLLYLKDKPYGMGKKSALYVVSMMDPYKEKCLIYKAFYHNNLLYFQCKFQNEIINIPGVNYKLSCKQDLNFFKGKKAVVSYVEPEHKIVTKIIYI